MQQLHRLPEPTGTSSVWYRGWEIGFEPERDAWTKSGWTAYLGGADLDARQVDAATFEACLDEVDETEDELR